ncbi:protein kinase-like domain-containing protein [Xylariomycetidae sp. FL2044]|nr:protein kinase-like domain-containing protein [Xylariomycetidae sp. FL2044]
MFVIRSRKSMRHRGSLGVPRSCALSKDPPHQGEEGECLMENNDGSCYTISRAPPTLPRAELLRPDGHVRLIHDAGDVSAVFSFGNTLILKVRSMNHPSPSDEEHKTLAFLSQKKLSFPIPEVLFRIKEADNTVYLFEPQMPGKLLNEIWWDMDDKQKDHVSSRVAQICQELRAFQSNTLTAVDYQWMDPLREKEEQVSSPEALRKHCEGALGMDCSSTYVSAHNDLGPTNILLDGEEVGIIDWDLAGYVPVEWVRTKFAVCWAYDVELVSEAGLKVDKEYRVRVERKLGEMGFPEVAKTYEELREVRHKEWVKSRPWLQ